jgi:hypothetical protein
LTPSSSPASTSIPPAPATASRSSSPIEVIRPGDRVFFEPGEKHLHGAAPNRFMAHVAIHQNDESGTAVTWGEHVGDEQYGAAHEVQT